MDNISIASLNVRGLREEKKRKKIYQHFRNLKLSVVCIQETHSSKSDIELWSKQWGNKIVYSHGETNSKGVAILTNPNDKDITMKEIYSDPNGRICVVKVNKHDKEITIVNIYAPNEDDPSFFKEVLRVISEIDSVELMLVGDFNLVLDPELDRLDKRRYAPQSFKVLDQTIDELDLTDSWRVRNPEVKRYSWTRKKRTNSTEISASRMDFALLSTGLNNKVNNVQYKYGYQTDHAMYYIEINTDVEPRGPGYWKFNTKLLHDRTFVMRTNEIISNATEKHAGSSPDKVWSCCKDECIRWARTRSKELALARKHQVNTLIKKIEEAENKLISDNINSNRKQIELDHLKMQLDKFIKEQSESAAFRSKVNYTLEYERNTKFFYSLEKSKYNKKTMTRLQKADGSVTTDPAEILAEQHRFYQELYANDPNVKFQLQNTSGKLVTVRDQELLDADITLEELTNTVKSLKKDKTPGVDGLTAEFFQFFWTKIGPVFHAALDHAFHAGKLHLSATRGVITLIPKRNKNPDLLKCWRPLTMLSSCYKILAKLLATRLKAVLPYLVSETQTGFMETRQISSTLRTSIDITRYNKGICGYVMFLDFEKCFDRISYTAILGSLKYFGIGNKFIGWSKLLLENFEATTTNNGHFSGYFPILRSCHQGCPIAPLFYLLCGETMALEILKNSNIHGITLNGLEHILAQFADDTQFFLDSKKSVENVINTLSDIELNIGLRVNYDKSAICRINNAPEFTCNKPLIWDPGGINVLGIEIFQDSDDSYNIILDKAVQILNQWQNRNLSVTGKVMTVNSLVGSMFVYLMQVELNPSKNFYIAFENAIRNYLWNGKRDKIPIKTLQAPKDQGGLKLVNMEIKNQALKIAQLFSQHPVTAAALSEITPTELGSLFWSCKINKVDLKKFLKKRNVNPFWEEVINHWFNFTGKVGGNTRDMQRKHEILWYNSMIRQNNEIMSNVKAVKAGCIYLADILENGKLINYERYNAKFPNTMTWLAYCGLCAAIPSSWLETQNTEDPATPSSMYTRIANKNTGKVTYVYSILLNQLPNNINKNYVKFCKITQLTYDEYCKAFTNISKVTLITKYRDFQYRLLVSAIFTNNRLYYWKKAETKLCEYCKYDVQTNKHLLIECSYSKNIWRKFIQYIKHNMFIDTTVIDFNDKNIMLNLVHPKPGHLINMITLIIKQMLFADKCLGQSHAFERIRNRITELYKLEKYYAKQKNVIHKHETKWSPFTGITNSQSNNENSTSIDTYIDEYISTM